VTETSSDATSVAPPPTKPPLWRRVLPTVIAAGLLAFVFARIDWIAFSAAMRELNYIAFVGYCAAWVLVLLSADSFGSIIAYRSSTAAISWSEFALVRGASYLPGVLNHHLAQGYLTWVISKLYRVRLARMAGATLLSYAGWLGCLLGCVAVAIPFTSLPQGYAPAIVGAGLSYLALIGIAPAFLSRISLLAPLFEAGVWGHLKVLFARVPHLLVMVLGTWGSFFFFGVNIPLGTALVYLPILLMAVTLPITPQGFGTRDALAGMFFLGFATGFDDGDKLAHITACTLSWGVVTTLCSAIVGVIATRRVNQKLRVVADESAVAATAVPSA
jgi:hypothetical protein